MIKKIKYLFNLYVKFRGNKTAYLRYSGVRIGNSCQILNRVEGFGSEPWLIEIGNNVTIAAGVYLLTHDGASRLFRNTIVNSSPFGNRFGRISILDNCFIGVNSVVLPGITIGPNSIVGAGSVVSKNVPPNTVVGGNPAKELSNLDEYIVKYNTRFIHILARNRKELRKELTLHFWGKER